ncbi:MAG: MarR family winged helix-turn-helix transcriptional regulator [Chloroflexota bacterium]
MDAYYPRVPEVPTHDPRLTEAAVDLLKVFRGMPRVVPPPLVRDLTLGQLRLLMLLRSGPQPMGAVADAFELSSTAATGFVDRVERHGLVERRHRQDDRRIVECVLTADGQHFLEEVVGVRIESVRQALGVLSPRQLSGFHRLVRHIIERQETQA